MSDPNLFLIGAAKGGSSTLAFHLASHPEVGMAAKEPNIFNQPTLEACRARLEAFRARGLDRRWVLDGSVNYSQHPKYPGVPGHIAALTDPASVRILYMLRHPVDRAISHYFWHRERFGEDRPITAACTPDSTYIVASRYDVQIRQYLDVFPAAQMRCLKHDTYFADVRGEFADLCRWLGIADDHVPDLELRRGATRKDVTRTSRFPLVNRLLRASPGLKRALAARIPQKYQKKIARGLSRPVARPEVTAAERRFLLDQFAESLAETEKLTGLDLSDWRR